MSSMQVSFGIQKKWTEEEINRANMLRDEGLTSAEIGQALGRGYGSVRDMFRRQRNGQLIRTGNNEPLTLEQKRFANALLREGKSVGEVAHILGRTRTLIWRSIWRAKEPTKRPRLPNVSRVEPLPETLEARDSRYLEPRTLTMELCGDPPPSQSALGRPCT